MPAPAPSPAAGRGPAPAFILAEILPGGRAGGARGAGGPPPRFAPESQTC
jgi:hypothetical protein